MVVKIFITTTLSLLSKRKGGGEVELTLCLSQGHESVTGAQQVTSPAQASSVAWQAECEYNHVSSKTPPSIHSLTHSLTLVHMTDQAVVTILPRNWSVRKLMQRANFIPSYRLVT